MLKDRFIGMMMAVENFSMSASVVFVAGVAVGFMLCTILISSASFSPYLVPPKRAKKKVVESPVKVKSVDGLSPVKILHRIASSFMKSEPQSDVEGFADLVECGLLAKKELFVILGLATGTEAMHLSWQHVFSNASSQFWVGGNSKNGIRLRGESFADCSACCIVNWLLQHDAVTGIEGLGGKTEILSRRATKDEIVIVRRFYCKAGSGSILSSKRDFKLVTCITRESDGTYVVATRSGPGDVDHASSTTGGSGTGTGTGSDTTKGHIRGTVYGSGYVLRPVLYEGEAGCEVSFGCHVDMKGARSGRGNTANVNAILSFVLRTIKSVHNGEADGFAHLEGQSLQYMERVSAWGQVLTRNNHSNIGRDGSNRATPRNSRQETSTPTAAVSGGPGGGDGPLRIDVDDDTGGEERVELHAPGSLGAHLSNNQPGSSLFNAALPTTADRYRLLSVGRDAANRLRAAYGDTLGADTVGDHAKPRSSFSGPFEVRRETFYSQDGIVLKEMGRADLTAESTSSLGIIAATFSVQAAPEAVLSLLVNRPDSVDGFVEGRSVLNHLSAETYVQWLAYGAIFPLEARDFLLVTTQEPWDKKANRGFVIASTSIDSMCEMDSPHRQSLSAASTPRANDGARAANNPRQGYQRAHLRLSGYVLAPEFDGSTLVTFLLDLPIALPRSSGWLLRYLTQYALTELVGRIRHAVSPFNLGIVDRSPRTVPSSSAASGNEEGSEDSNTAPLAYPDKLLGGGGARTADLGRMLAGIQDREKLAARRNGNVERVPVANNHRRDRTASVEYWHPDDNTNQGQKGQGLQSTDGTRARLNSDHSGIFNTWKDVRSRSNSAVRLSSGDYSEHQRTSSLGEDSLLSEGGGNHTRLPPHSPAGRGGSGGGGGIASIGKEKGLSTFALLKRSLSKKKSNKSATTPTGSPASSLRLRHPADSEDSDYRADTPEGSPWSARKTMASSTPATGSSHSQPRSSLTGLRLGSGGARGGGKGEEVDLHSVQRELGKISPARRHSRTAQRRRSMSQSDDLALPTAAVPMQAPAGQVSVAAPGPVHRSQSDATHLDSHHNQHHHHQQSRSGSGAGKHHPHHMSQSQSMDDLATYAAKNGNTNNADDLPQEAWRMYHTYFDETSARSQLGIDWQLKLSKPNIHIFSSMVQGNSWCAIKAVTVMRCAPMALVQVLLDYSRMGEYDNMFKCSELVQQVDANTVIRRLCFKEVWPTAPRDFVVCASWRQNEDGSVSIVSRSVSDDHCAQEKGYVRGFLQVSGYRLEPYDEGRPVALPLSCAKEGKLAPGECKVTLLNHTELGGTLPASVINVLSTNAPLKILSTLSSIVSTK